MQEIFSIEIEDQEKLLSALVSLSKNCDDFCLLNSNKYPDNYGRFEILCGVGCTKKLDLKELFLKRSSARNDWVFLHLSYDLKNQIEELTSSNPENINFENLSGFVPEYLFQLKKKSNTLQILSSSEGGHEIINEFKKLLASEYEPKIHHFPRVKPRIIKEKYLDKIKKLKQFIQDGDIYEANFCMEFFAEDIEISAADAYLLLNSISPAPFSAFYKQKDKYLISASPERFLAKKGNTILTQPIKGTIRRGRNNEQDEKLKEQLKNDPKEQTENIMIVDVARNDLSRVANRSSVEVEELFGIYSFPQVHQMVSTILCEVSDELSFGEIIKATFPMASMTGAPKISAMKILDTEEGSSRNLYSGSVGYISPEGDFDLNVVIRSLLYNNSKKYLSYSTGGAITAMSDPEMEYQECLLKAKAIFG